MTWLQAFALTQAVEVPVYAFRLRPATLSHRVTMALAVSTATHPWVWFVLPPYLQPSLGYWGYLFCVEPLVILAEGALLWGFGVRVGRAFGAAAVANVLSAATGVAVIRLLG